MQKIVKVNKTELDKMVLSENKDLNIFFCKNFKNAN